MDNQAGAETVIARIRGAIFHVSRWDGYDEQEVDNFLDEMIARLGRGEPVGLGGAPVFTTRRLRPGYRKVDVDALLRELGV